MTVFSADIVDRVLHHMNDDHTDDNVVIARAFGFPEATASQMVNLDAHAGYWRVDDQRGSHELRIEWPGAPISERPEIRAEVVKIYTTAHERLGLAPRATEEHAAGDGESAAHATPGDGAANPHGSHAADRSTPADELPQPASTRRGHGHPGHGRHADLGDESAGFAKTVRERTWTFHSESEGAGFMSGIMQDGSPLDDYTQLVVQHFFMYQAIEAQSAKFRDDELFRAFDTPALHRMQAIEADLEHLLGAGWRNRIAPLPATVAYADRVTEVGNENWVPGVIAHHYTRYLGDLSGGQMIAKRMRKRHGLDGDGVRFYEFGELGPLGKFKNDYRSELDRLGERLDAAEKERFLEEVRVAYQCNTDVFNDLARQKAGQLAS